MSGVKVYWIGMNSFAGQALSPFLKQIPFRGGYLFRWLRLSIVLSLLLSLSNLVPAWHWIQEVNRNLGFYYLGLHLVSLLLCWLILPAASCPRKGWALNIALVGMSLFYISSLTPFYLPRSERDHATESHLRLFYANVDNLNTHYAEMRTSILASRADLVALLETDPSWLKELNLSSEFPYQSSLTREGKWGLAVYSRFPIAAAAQLTDVGDGLPPVFIADLNIADRQKVKFVLLHTYAPLSQMALHKNRIYLRRISTILRHNSDNVLVAGDFNATPFSKFYSKFLWGARLESAMQGFGLQRSWDAHNIFQRLTLDHILYRGNFGVEDFRKLPAQGSDHYPYVVDFGFE